jgi:hypothetical protein
MGRPLRLEYAGVLHRISSRGNEKRDIFLRGKGVVKGKVVNEDIVERSRLREGPSATEILQVVAEKYGEEAEALRQRGRNKEARKGANYLMKRYSGLSNLDELVRSRKTVFFVIPAKAGIQVLRALAGYLDPGFHSG